MTDMVYPGAMHTRFEHSIGVMHTASLMFDKIVEKREAFLKNELGFNDNGLERCKIILRLSALLHDIGHAPFSHVAECLMPINKSSGYRFTHEDYSCAIIEHTLKDVIENNNTNTLNFKITAGEISLFVSKKPKPDRSLIWRNLISSQLDADRADYLLRDSHHAGVQYGKYDIHRLIHSLSVVYDTYDSPVIAIEEGGIHAAEALIIARYMMFTQVYFHHARRAYDHHISNCIRAFIISDSGDANDDGTFPPPDSMDNIDKYLEWDDWKVLGMLKANPTQTDSSKILKRKHDRCIHQTGETPSPQDLEKAEQIQHTLEELGAWGDSSAASWYKFESSDILVLEEGNSHITPLSILSPVVRGLKSINRMRVYVPESSKTTASEKIRDL
jgi:hypothetical protein